MTAILYKPPKTIRLSKFKYEHLPFKPFQKRVKGINYLDGFWTNSLKAAIKKVLPRGSVSLKCIKSCLKAGFNTFKRLNKRRKKLPRLRVTIDITLIRVLVIFFLAWAWWPHPGPTHVGPEVVPEIGLAVSYKIPRLEAVEAPRFTSKPLRHPVPVPEPPPPPVATRASCATFTSRGNSYMDYIFEHESTNNSCAVNELGCIGLGQSCPGGSGLAADCPNWRSDIDCQVSHFAKYANEVYGGWAGAYAFWVVRHWW